MSKCICAANAGFATFPLDQHRKATQKAPFQCPRYNLCAMLLSLYLFNMFLSSMQQDTD